MDDVCANLELNCSHPAIHPRGNEYSIVSEAITLLRKSRETFIHDAGARNRACYDLQNAREIIKPCLLLYDCLRTINLTECPPRHDHSTCAKAKWEYGLLGEWIDADADPEDDVKPVKFDIGLGGFMCLLKTKPPRHFILGHAHREFAFMGLDTRLLMETLLLRV